MSHDTEQKEGKVFRHQEFGKSRSEVFEGGYIDTALLSRVISIQCPITDNVALFCLCFSYSRSENYINPKMSLEGKTW